MVSKPSSRPSKGLVWKPGMMHGSWVTWSNSVTSINLHGPTLVHSNGIFEYYIDFGTWTQYVSETEYYTNPTIIDYHIEEGFYNG